MSGALHTSTVSKRSSVGVTSSCSSGAEVVAVLSVHGRLPWPPKRVTWNDGCGTRNTAQTLPHLKGPWIRKRISLARSHYHTSSDNLRWELQSNRTLRSHGTNSLRQALAWKESGREKKPVSGGTRRSSDTPSMWSDGFTRSCLPELHAQKHSSDPGTKK